MGNASSTAVPQLFWLRVTRKFVSLAPVRTALQTLTRNLGHQIQLADQAWPSRNDGIAAIRKDFLLPVDRPLRN
jgi:hypothetical protein